MVTINPTGAGRTGTIQTWTAPAAGPYEIEVRGAAGGIQNYSSGVTEPALWGYGAIMRATFTLAAGEQLKILVGERGAINASPEGFAGGGGGTFVTRADNTLLIAAGGGANFRAYTGSTVDRSRINASTGTSGNAGLQAGGSDGGGGASSASGMGGAGFRGNAATYSGYAEGYSFLNGGAGSYNTGHTQNWGGFGGGGAGGWGGSGGGGGYSGGGGGPNNTSTNAHGGGGGSFVSSQAASGSVYTSDGTFARTGTEPDSPYTGTIQSLGGAFNTGTSGLVTITSLDVPPTATITAPTAGQKLDPRQPLRMTWTYSDTEGSPQAQYEAAFGVGGSGTPQALSNSTTGRTGTIQTWTVPSSGTYKIECWGAEGGAGNGGVGGKGAYRYGEMTLSAGEQIAIIVGQAGVRSSTNYEGGGGGGSFVYRQASVELLCAAGGGGGASNSGYGGDAVITEAGGAAPQSGAAGGTGGNGGTASHSSGGGGWHTMGGVGTWSSGTYTQNRPGNACKPGGTYDTNADGAQARGGQNTTAGGPVGGFGGGASAHGNSYTAGGGGGGYSGGGGATQAYGGGGGGSFVHASMTNTGGTAGTRTGHGSVTITPVMAWTTSTVASSNAYHDFSANAFPDEKQVTLRVRVHDGTQWGAYATVDITSDSWTYGSEVTSAIQTGVDLPELVAGSYEAQVRTSDAVGFGSWSASAAFTVLPTSNVKIYQGGAWHTVPNRLRHQGSWVVPPNPERL